MKDFDALTLFRRMPRADASRYERLAETRQDRRAWNKLHQSDRQFYNEVTARVRKAVSPVELSVTDQIRLTHQIMARGGMILALDLEWSQAGSGFIYEMGFSAHIDGKYRTDNLMIRVPEDPKVRVDEFRNGRSINVDPDGARAYLDDMWPHVDAICVHGGSEDAIKMAVFGYPLTSKHVIDTQTIAAALYPEVRQRVVDLHRYFGGRHLRHHVAGNDAEMALRVLHGMMRDPIVV